MNDKNPEQRQPASGSPLPPAACSGFTVEPRWWPTTLWACPPGLFKFEGGFGFKTEYTDENGPEAYCVESGEYFWGGTNDPEKRRNLIVTPVIISPNTNIRQTDFRNTARKESE